jgi:DNA-binding NarL/FixJ family response regulator
MNILLVDDHPLFCEAAKALVTRHWPQAMLQSCGTLSGALAALSTGRCDLLLLDLTLTDSDGLATLQQVRRACPALTVVVLSADERRETVLAAIDAGASGYIPKSSNPQAMRQALQVVLDGGVFLPPATLVQDGHAAARGAPPADPLAGLSARQIDVLRLLVRGLPNKTIARELDVSEATVKTHMAALYRKLEVDSRTQAVLAAARLGLRLGA